MLSKVVLQKIIENTTGFCSIATLGLKEDATVQVSQLGAAIFLGFRDNSSAGSTKTTMRSSRAKAQLEKD